MPIRYYTSKVSPHETASEIQRLLSRHGARTVQLAYDDGAPVAVEFEMLVGGDALFFRLAPDPPGILRAMRKDDDIGRRYLNDDQATRTAWRLELAWLETCLARVEANQARFEQLLLGYGVTDTGDTVFERLMSNHKLLTK